MAEKKNEFIKVLTPKFRVSFPNVFQAKAIRAGDEPKFSISMIFDKEAQESDAYKEMRRAASKAKKQKFGDKTPDGFRNPFKDAGDKKQFEGYEDGLTFISSNTKQKPGLVNQKVEDIIDPQEFYAGCYARATVLAFAYDTAGNKGVGFLLSNIQKVADGEQISGKSKASDDFDALAEDTTSFDSGEDDDDFDL